ncbi:MAG: DUF2914 domain-containing protein [candidate division WOR-3 bacterium]
MKKLFVVLFLIINLNAIEVKEAYICRNVENRNPVQADTLFESGVGYLYCFTVIKADVPDTIYHEWVYNNEVKAKVKLFIKTPSENYRTWSKKTIMSLFTGEWTVRIKNAKDSLLKEIKFKIK